MFYTALGHSASNYGSDQNFINHVTDAQLWVIGLPVGIGASLEESLQRIISHRNGMIRVEPSSLPNGEIQLYNAMGQKLRSASINSGIPTHDLPEGWYVVNVVTEGERLAMPIIVY